MPFNIHRHGFKRLLLAVSGGLDSICLAHFFIKNREALGIEWLGIAHVHHGLREGTADRDAAFVEAFAKSHGVPFFLKKLDGEALKAAEGSLEENAREARYKALMEIAMSSEPSAVSNEPSEDRIRESFMDGAKPQPFGSIISMLAWLRHSPFGLSIGASPLQDDNEKTDPGTGSGMTNKKQDDKPLTTCPIAQSEATSKALRAESIASLQNDKSLSSFVYRLSSIIVTAHHAGDQAETMLMRLKRGTTLAGLRGIQELRPLETHVTLESCKADRIHDNSFMDPIGASPLQDDRCSRSFDCAQDDKPIITSPKTQSEATSKCHRHDLTPHTPPSFVSRLSSFVYLYRPFLNVTRSELLAYAHKHNLTWCEDESNTDIKFARNSIRHQLLPHLEKEVPGATAQLCRIAGLADKAYANILNKCKTLFATCLKKSMDSLPSVENNALQDDKPITTSLTAQSEATSKALRAEPITHSPSSIVSYIAIDKKKLNKILQAHKDADLSELFRLWLSELGFRFPTGFFYAPKELAHIKIPIRASYRKRSIIKIRHTVWICEFNDTESALKFVSCEMKEKGLYE